MTGINNQSLTAIIILFVAATSAQAGHHNARFHQLDDLVFSAYVDARDLRWEIHDDFVDSHDYDHLLEDADEILFKIQHLQSTVLREQSDAHIARDIDLVRRAIDNLTQHLGTCDFARSRRSHRTSLGRNGYVFTPETAHVGRIHVDAALTMIRRIEGSLSALEHEVIDDHVRHHPTSRVAPVQPTHGPVLSPRNAPYGRHRSITVPIGKHGDNQFVFRIGF